MQTIKHKLYGEGTIINKEDRGIGSIITVRFESSGKEARFVIPDSFTTGLFEVGEDLQTEINAAVEAKREAARLARESEANASSAAKAARMTGASTGAAVMSSNDTAVRDGYEAYLITNRYAEITPPGGSPSTVPQYIRAVESVLEEEHLTWSTLESRISRVIALYGEGGAKEALGNKSNKTWINALKRFEEFC